MGMVFATQVETNTHVTHKDTHSVCHVATAQCHIEVFLCFVVFQYPLFYPHQLMWAEPESIISFSASLLDIQSELLHVKLPSKATVVSRPEVIFKELQMI